MAEERMMRITHLRGSLGWAYRFVVETDEPIVIQRYKALDVMLVPAWEWRFLKQMEADIRAGRCPWEDDKARQYSQDRAMSGALPDETHTQGVSTVVSGAGKSHPGSTTDHV